MWEVLVENWFVIVGIIGSVTVIFAVGKVWGKRGERLHNLEEDVKEIKKDMEAFDKTVTKIDKCLGKLETKLDGVKELLERKL